MKNSKPKNFTLLFVIYIIAIAVKDYVFPRITFMTTNGNESFAGSLRDALLQFSVLFVFVLIFFIFKYNRERSRAVIKKRKTVDSFSSIINWKPCSKVNVVLCVIIGITSYISFQLFKNVYLVINYSITYNDELIPIQQTNIDALPVVMLFLVYAIWVVLSEEFFYRSMLFSEILKRNRLFAYLFSVIIFALAHNSFEQIVQATFLAIVLCVIFEKTASVIPCIIIHIIYNMLGVINTYIYSPEYGILRYDLFAIVQYDYWLEAIKLSILGVVTFGIVIIFMSKIKKTVCPKNEKAKERFSSTDNILILIIIILNLLKLCAVVINSS